ncbi:MAG: FAD-dependent oxidoreductase [Oscillospiraceae bacterium]|jgi:hypothetical protein|nr:FAD-dependent oxidoreductase [Oscillospiraceae bacterium]
MAVINYGREIEIRREVDVFVGGGGPAGVAAAVAAAREGASVFLAESTCSVGGMGTIGMVPEFMPVSDGVNLLCAGLGKEIMDKAYAYSDKSHEYMKINKEALKRAYDDIMADSGADFRFASQIIDVKARDGKIDYVILSCKSGIYAVKAKMVIDCTGDGDICAMAGADFAVGDENGAIMPATLCSLWTGIDWENTMDAPPHQSFVEQAFAEGVLPVCDRNLPGVRRVAANCGGGNVGHAFGVDGTDEASVTKAMAEQRCLLPAYQIYFNKYIRGFENARIISTAEVLGVRASRRITGDYVLKLADFKARAVFSDEIGRYCYSVDNHPATPDQAAFEKFRQEFLEDYHYGVGDSYGIPYRALTPKGLSNVYTAGRCISTDHYMQASVRVMPGCYITGQAAGTAASLAAASEGDVRSVDVTELQKTLRKNGVYLPATAPERL